MIKVMMTFCCHVIHAAADRLHILLLSHSSTGKPQRASEVVCRQVKSLQVEAKVTFVHVFGLCFWLRSLSSRPVFTLWFCFSLSASLLFLMLSVHWLVFTSHSCWSPPAFSLISSAPSGQFTSVRLDRSCKEAPAVHVMLALSWCSVSVFLCSEECNQRQSGASGVLLECLLVREVSQEKKERAGPETPPGAEWDPPTHQNPGQNPSEPFYRKAKLCWSDRCCPCPSDPHPEGLWFW